MPLQEDSYMDTQMLIGSKFQAGTETEEAILNPRTGRKIIALPEASQAQIDAAVAAAGKAFSTWSRTTPAQRSLYLLKVAERIETDAQAFAELEALNCGVVAGIMKRVNPDVNMVSAPVVAKERGIKISTTNQDKSGAFDGYIKVTVVTDKRERSIAGTVFSDGKPRFIQIKGINIDAEIGAHMLYTTNEDVPGIIGTLGQTLGANGVNIANFTLGRAAPRGEAIALLYVDELVSAETIAKLKDTGLFRQVKPLQFDVA